MVGSVSFDSKGDKRDNRTGRTARSKRDRSKKGQGRQAKLREARPGVHTDAAEVRNDNDHWVGDRKGRKGDGAKSASSISLQSFSTIMTTG